MLEEFVNSVLNFITQHAEWAGLIMFLLAFGESLIIVGILLPATWILVASGALISNGIVSFWDIVPAAILGGFLGDWASYMVGRHFDKELPHLWPFKQNPQILEKALIFFERYGILSVFICRFMGPLRATIPTIAGMLDMPIAKFQLANITSAIIWTPLIMSPGAILGWFFLWLK